MSIPIQTENLKRKKNETFETTHSKMKSYYKLSQGNLNITTLKNKNE